MSESPLAVVRSAIAYVSEMSYMGPARLSVDPVFEVPDGRMDEWKWVVTVLLDLVRAHGEAGLQRYALSVAMLVEQHERDDP